MRPELGGVMVFAALIMVVLCGFFALTVDIGRFSDAKEQKVEGAEEAAVAALHDYLSSDVKTSVCAKTAYGCRHAKKFLGAKDIAAAVGSWNFQTILNDVHVSSTADLDPGPDRRGELVSGRWWDAMPEACTLGPSAATPCPCGATTFPCFQACPDNAPGCAPLPASASAPDHGFASAMRLVFYTPPNGRLHFLFGDVLGMPDAKVEYAANAASSPAVATILPKFTALLVDLGRNMQIDTFQPWEKNPAHPVYAPVVGTSDYREFAYHLVGGCPGTIDASATIDPNSPNPDVLTAAIANPGYADSWANLGAAEYLQYECVTNPYPAGTSYLVSKVNDTTAWVAQPLRDSLTALNAYLREFAQSAAGPDVLCPIFYDHKIRSKASFGFTNDCFQKGSSDFQKLLKMTDPRQAVWNDATDTCFDGTHGCWSGKYVGMYPRQGAFSDLPRAIDAAEDRILNYGGFVNWDNAIVSFTNGLSNCVADSGGVVHCRGFLKNQPGFIDNPGLQNEYYGMHKASLDEFLNSRVNYDLQSRAIKFHSYFVGQSVLPHTATIRTQGAGGSTPPPMTEGEIRQRHLFNVLRYPPVDDDADPVAGTDDLRSAYDGPAQYSYHSLGMTAPPIASADLLPAPNLPAFPTAQLAGTSINSGPPTILNFYPTPAVYFYSAAVITQGNWVPIRPFCPNPNWAPPGTLKTIKYLVGVSLAPPAAPATPFTSEIYSAYKARSAANLPLLTAKGIVDQYGRLLCDPSALVTIIAPETAVSTEARTAAFDILTNRPITLVKAP